MKNINLLFHLYCVAQFLTSAIFNFPFQIAHEAAADCRFERMHHERDYPGMCLDHRGYQKTLLVKSDMHILGQEAHQVPQGCPMGPKFLVQNFSHTSSNELILWVLWIGYAENAEKHKKLLILAQFLSNKG